MFKKYIVLSFSSSIVNFMIGVMLWNIVSTSFILVVPFSINYENVIYIVEISNYMRFQQNVNYLFILRVLQIYFGKDR
jgi:hypothetical protein